MSDMDISIRVASDGTVSVKKNLDSVADSAERAMGATDNLKKSLQFGKAAPSIRTAANDFRALTVAANSSAATIRSITPAFGTFGTAARSAATTGSSAMEAFNATLQRVKTGMASFGTSIATGVQSAIGRINALKTSLTSVRPAMAGVGAAAGASSLNVANLAAQFNDIGVTAAMMQSPLQIALQQGTQISQVFGSMGAAGAVRMLGQAFLSVISPLSLLTIGTVAAVAAMVQAVNWSKVMAAALGLLSDAIGWLRDNIDTLRPYLIAVGGAMVVAFGPAVLGMVQALTVAIAKGLYGAFVGLFKLIMKNPIVAALTGIITVLSFVIEGTIGWQRVLQGVVEWAGMALEAVGRVAELFGQSGSWTQKGIQIQINAKQAAADLLDAAKRIGSGMLDSIDKGVLSLKEGLVDGSKTGAELLKKGVASGADDLAKKADQSIKSGGEEAGKSMGQQISDAGSKFTYNLSTTMSDILAGFEKFGGDLLWTLDKMSSLINAQLSLAWAQVSLARAEAAKTRAETNAINMRAQDDRRKALNPNGGTNNTSGFGFADGFANGGQFKVGGTGAGRDTTPVAFRAERGERVTVETKRQQRSANNNQAPEVNVPVGITNVFDPEMIPAANRSVSGQRSIVNVIADNRDEVAAILGVA